MSYHDEMKDKIVIGRLNFGPTVTTGSSNDNGENIVSESQIKRIQATNPTYLLVMTKEVVRLTDQLKKAENLIASLSAN